MVNLKISQLPASVNPDGDIEIVQGGTNNKTNLKARMNELRTGTTRTNKISYFDNSGNEIDLPLGTNGQVLTSTGPAAAPIFQTPGSSLDEKVKAAAGDPTAGFLDAKVQNSIVVDGATFKMKLQGDATTPGNNKYYGTDGAGTKGFYDIPNCIAHIESFVATLNQTAFVLANTPASNNFVWVSLSTGAYGKQDAIYDYTVSGNTVTLNNPASAGDVITVQYVENLGALTSVTVANIGAGAGVIANPGTASSFNAKSITTSGIGLTLTPSATEINVETNTLAKIVYVTNGMSPYTVLGTEELIVADTTGGAVTIDLNGTPAAVPTKTKIHRLGTGVVTVQASGGSGDFNVVGIDTINLNSNGTSIEVISLGNPGIGLVNFLTTAFVGTTYTVASPIISIS